MGRLGYRLGESITAVLNFSKSSMPCHHISVYLESHETVEPDFASKSKDYLKMHTKQCHGEFHQSVLNSKRSAVVLNIPSRATPDFVSTAISVNWSLRICFITGSGQSVYYTSSNREGFAHSRAFPISEVEPFDCTIPLKIYGALKASTQQKKVLEFEI